MAWEVSQLALFSDSSCAEPLPGGVAVTDENGCGGAEAVAVASGTWCGAGGSFIGFWFSAPVSTVRCARVKGNIDDSVVAAGALLDHLTLATM